MFQTYFISNKSSPVESILLWENRVWDTQFPSEWENQVWDTQFSSANSLGKIEYRELELLEMKYVSNVA